MVDGDTGIYFSTLLPRPFQYDHELRILEVLNFLRLRLKDNEFT